MNKTYCNQCHELLILYDDGEIFCSCSGIERGQDEPKAWWPCTREDIRNWRATELTDG